MCIPPHYSNLTICLDMATNSCHKTNSTEFMTLFRTELLDLLETRRLVLPSLKEVSSGKPRLQVLLTNPPTLHLQKLSEYSAAIFPPSKIILCQFQMQHVTLYKTLKVSKYKLMG